MPNYESLEVLEESSDYIQTFLEDFHTNPSQALSNRGVTLGSGTGLPGGRPKIAYIRDIKAANKGGGRAIPADTWVGRDLNDLLDDDSIGITLSNNEFTLPAGTYDIEGITSTRNLSYGIHHRIISVGGSPEISCEFTNQLSLRMPLIVLPTARTFEIQFNSNSWRNNNNSLGVSSQNSQNIYTVIKVMQWVAD